MSDIKQRPNAVNIIVAVLLLGIGGGLVKSLRHNFTDSIGHWGGVVAAGIAFAIAVLAITLLFRMSWRRRALLGLLIPTGVLSYEEIGAALNQSLGKFPSEAIGGVAAVTICWLLSKVLSKCCGIQWDDASQPASRSENA